jgi:hypothetical protein
MRVSADWQRVKSKGISKKFLQYKSSPLGIFVSLQLKDELAFCRNSVYGRCGNKPGVPS